jgi:hypothetical protein
LRFFLIDWRCALIIAVAIFYYGGLRHLLSFFVFLVNIVFAGCFLLRLCAVRAFVAPGCCCFAFCGAAVGGDCCLRHELADCVGCAALFAIAVFFCVVLFIYSFGFLFFLIFF